MSPDDVRRRRPVEPAQDLVPGAAQVHSVHAPQLTSGEERGYSFLGVQLLRITPHVQVRHLHREEGPSTSSAGFNLDHFFLSLSH